VWGEGGEEPGRGEGGTRCQGARAGREWSQSRRPAQQLHRDGHRGEDGTKAASGRRDEPRLSTTHRLVYRTCCQLGRTVAHCMSSPVPPINGSLGLAPPLHLVDGTSRPPNPPAPRPPTRTDQRERKDSSWREDQAQLQHQLRLAKAEIANLCVPPRSSSSLARAARRSQHSPLACIASELTCTPASSAVKPSSARTRAMFRSTQPRLANPPPLSAGRAANPPWPTCQPRHRPSTPAGGRARTPRRRRLARRTFPKPAPRPRPRRAARQGCPKAPGPSP